MSRPRRPSEGQIGLIRIVEEEAELTGNDTVDTDNELVRGDEYEAQVPGREFRPAHEFEQVASLWLLITRHLSNPSIWPRFALWTVLSLWLERSGWLPTPHEARFRTRSQAGWVLEGRRAPAPKSPCGYLASVLNIGS